MTLLFVRFYFHCVLASDLAFFFCWHTHWEKKETAICFDCMKNDYLMLCCCFHLCSNCLGLVANGTQPLQWFNFNIISLKFEILTKSKILIFISLFPSFFVCFVGWNCARAHFSIPLNSFNPILKNFHSVLNDATVPQLESTVFGSVLNGCCVWISVLYYTVHCTSSSLHILRWNQINPCFPKMCSR